MSCFDLVDLNVIVTRPLQQATPLMQLIAMLGGNPISFPTLEILNLPQNQIPDIGAYLQQLDLAIFISKNAVIKALPLLKKKTFKIAAIGPSTAKTLFDHQLPVDIMPGEKFDSEHLFAMPYFKNIQHQKIAIFAGIGGRCWLEDQLRLKGAEVKKIAVYQRCCPNVGSNKIEQLLKLCNNVIISTSSESLQNLYKILQEYGHSAWLLHTPLVIISKRMKELALGIGFKKNFLLEAEDATDTAILECLIKWYSKRQTEIRV